MSAPHTDISPARMMGVGIVLSFVLLTIAAVGVVASVPFRVAGWIARRTK